jgi:predicted GIY-YIG superfamily endonuclease
VGVFFKKDIYCEMKELIRHIIREHLELKTEGRFLWTKELAKKEADKYNNLKDFLKYSKPTYHAVKRYGWFDELTSHMSKEREKKWTKDLIHDIAKKYNTKVEFLKGDNGAYQAAKKYGWLDDVTSHMIPDFRWTKEMVRSEAEKYKNKRDFRNGSPKAYGAGLEYGWIDDVTQHMEPLGNKFKRMVYVFEFPDKSVYVGLTLDIERRTREHYLTDSGVSRYIEETNLEPKFKSVTTEYINKEDAAKLERELVEKYKSEGWNVLNRIKAGGLGGNKERFWNPDSVKQEIAKYKKLVDFRKGSPSAYLAVKTYGWHDLTKGLERSIIWNKEDAHKEALKYNNRSEFQKKSTSAYQYAKRNGLLDDICSHMEWKGGQNWDKKSVEKEALKYSIISDFIANGKGAYNAAKRNGWLDDVTKHMEDGRTKYWTDERVKDEASNYKTRTEFAKGNQSAYNVANKNGWLDELFPK